MAANSSGIASACLDPALLSMPVAERRPPASQSREQSRVLQGRRPYAQGQDSASNVGKDGPQHYRVGVEHLFASPIDEAHRLGPALAVDRHAQADRKEVDDARVGKQSVITGSVLARRAKLHELKQSRRIGEPGRRRQGQAQWIARIVEKGLGNFPAEERNARLERIHEIAVGPAIHP